MPGFVTLGVTTSVVVAAGAGWAFTVILSPAPGAPVPDSYTLVTAVEGDVGAHLTLNVAAHWQLSPVATNQTSGVVTSVDTTPGQLVGQGDRFYSVNERPVVAAQGDVPAYRAIGAGIGNGADVAQLQRMLGALGFYSGAADGSVGASTVAAIDSWQRSLGLDATGEVGLGDVLFVPRLPARLVLASDTVKRGATLSGGETVVSWLGDAPVFTLPVSEEQSAQVPTGTRVVIDDGAGDTWQAVAAGRSQTETGTVQIDLTAPAAPTAAAGAAGAPTDPAASPGTTQPGASGESGAGVPICATTCDVVPVTGQTLFLSRVVTVETVHGTVVPSAALQSTADQRVVVVDSTGASHEVTVTAASQGMSVVTGIDAGLSIEIPMTASSAPGGVAPAPPAPPSSPVPSATPSSPGAQSTPEAGPAGPSATAGDPR